MAGERCSLTCNVKSPGTGKVKVSALWEDLAKFFKGDRREAVTHYFLTKDNNFLRENSDVLEFDADGEVTISSLKKALEKDGEYSKLSNAKTLEHLNREIGAGRYEYSEALDNVLKFNKQNQFNQDFLATLRREEDGKYTVKVVERNPSTEAELTKHVENKLQQDALTTLLENQGLSVEFLTNPKFVLKYSTGERVEGADGLLSVGQVMSGLTSSAATAEVAGHFIVGAMRDNPLVERLMGQLTEEVQEALFKNPKSNLYREDFIVSPESAREAAGILVGKELIAPFKEDGGKWYRPANIAGNTIKGIKWLLSKIKNLAKRIFGVYTPDVVSKMVEDTKRTAATVAQGYLRNAELTYVNDLFETPETYAVVRSSKYLSKEVQDNVNAFKETIGYLKDTISKLKDITNRSENPENKELLKELKELYSDILTSKTTSLDIESFAKNASIEGMIYTIENITHILDTNVRNLLDSVQPSDRVSSYNNIVENARSMRTIETIVKNMAQLYVVMSGKVDSLSATDIQQTTVAGTPVVETLREALTKLDAVLGANDEIYADTQHSEQTVHGLRRLMELKSRQVWSDFAANVYGKDYIERNAGVVWMQQGSRKKLVRSDKIKGYNIVKYKDWIASMDEDISLIDRYIRSAADCGDFITSTGYKVTRNALMRADRITERFWNEGETLRIQMEELFGTTDGAFLYETTKDEDGNTVRTGNFIAPVNHGEWEAARKKYAEKIKKGFNEYITDLRKKAYENNKNTPSYVFSLTDFQRGILYHTYADPLWSKWHQENSEEDSNRRKIPNHVKYHNPEFDRLFDYKNPSLSEQEKNAAKRKLSWYNSLMEMKKEIDSMLPTNAAIPWRAPQFTGLSYHRFNNLKAKMSNSMPAFWGMLRKQAQDLIVVREDEAYLFGSNNEFNEIEEDPLENNMYFEKEKTDRLPLFGINKLKDMSNLSTDLFGNLTRYASMAANYVTMAQIVDIAELGSDVINHRKVGGVIESNRRSESRAKARYMKFLKNNVYGVHVAPVLWDSKGTLRKFAATLSGFASKLMLGGNVVGGMVNTGTGMIEIFKEAATGESFTTSDIKEAHSRYFSGLFKDGEYLTSFANMFTDPLRPMDKNSLWIRHWNILGKNQQFYRTQKYDATADSALKANNRLWHWYDHVIWLPYSSGDHYMQTIPFYALGIHEKVYDREGNAMSLMDAYEVTDGEEIYAIGDDEKANSLGKTYKGLKLKDNIFRSVADIETYDTVIGMVNKVADFFDSHPNLKNNDAIAPTLFSERDKEYLDNEGFSVPQTAKQLISLRTALASKAAELKYNENDESEFMDKCRNITNRLHGIYNMEDKTALNNNILGNMFLAMKGYALGYINRNFSENYYNPILGKNVEGSYNTLMKIFAYSCFNMNDVDNWKRVSETLLLTVPLFNMYGLFNKNYNNKLKANLREAGFEDFQFYNMRRVGFNFLAIEALFMLGWLTSLRGPFGLEGDDDKNIPISYNPALGIMHYLFYRWNKEQRAYAEPIGMWDESSSLLSLPVGFSGFAQALDIMQLFIRTQLDKIGEQDKKNSALYYQQSKRGLYEKGDEKWWIKFKRLIPYWRSKYPFAHPREAKSSYEYGRRVRK